MTQQTSIMTTASEYSNKNRIELLCKSCLLMQIKNAARLTQLA